MPSLQYLSFFPSNQISLKLSTLERWIFVDRRKEDHSIKHLNISSDIGRGPEMILQIDSELLRGMNLLRDLQISHPVDLQISSLHSHKTHAAVSVL